MNIAYRTVLPVLIASTTLQFAPTALGAPNTSAQQAFQKMLSGLDAAEKRHDLDTWPTRLRQICRPNATFTLVGAPTIGLDLEIAGERSTFGKIGAIKIDTERIVQMTFKGKTAQAIVSYNLVMEGPPHQPDIHESDLITFHLVQSGGKWLISNATIKPQPDLKQGAAKNA